MKAAAAKAAMKQAGKGKDKRMKDTLIKLMKAEKADEEAASLFSTSSLFSASSPFSASAASPFSASPSRKNMTRVPNDLRI